MLEQLTNPALCKQLISTHLNYFTFEVDEWLAKEANYALIDEDNLGFAELKQPGTYWVHFCFNSARGRNAVRLARAMLEQLKAVKGACVAIGSIAPENHKAKWVIRQLGFTYLGDFEEPTGPAELFYLILDGA